MLLRPALRQKRIVFGRPCGARHARAALLLLGLFLACQAAPVLAARLAQQQTEIRKLQTQLTSADVDPVPCQ
jgi:hypothetical protein